MKMKNSIGAVLLLAAWALPSHAQIGEQRQNFAVGFNGGININSVSFSPTVRQKSLMGINGGLTARYISEKYFSMICGAQVELNFSQHGWSEFDEDHPELDAWNNYTSTPEQHDKNVENKFDYGITGGAGLELRTKAGNFLVEGRYYYALSDFYKSTKKDYFSRSAHGTIVAKITYLFDLKK